MEEKICNTIALCQMSINELKDIKKRLENNCTDDATFLIRTKEFNPFTLATYRHNSKFDVSLYTLNLILDEAIRKEKERIDKLIDMEIERRMKEE